ncbi:MAG: 1-acyl-sn-glycerol-3-phosphate acyltransferase [Bacteroidota bacterium]
MRESLGYRLLYPYVRWVYTALYCRTFEVVGAERVPLDRPVVFVVTHQNNLPDACAVLFATPRRPVFVARADLFRSPLVARALGFLRILPMYRADHGRRAIEEKLPETMDRLRTHLISRGACVIMAEGTSATTRTLRRLKKGWARLVLDTLPEAEGLVVVPVAVEFSNWYAWGPDQRVTVGEPLVFEPASVGVPRHLNEMNARLHSALARLIRSDDEIEAWHRQISAQRTGRDALWRVVGLPALAVLLVAFAPVLVFTQWRVYRHPRADFRATIEVGTLAVGMPIWALGLGLVIAGTLGWEAFLAGAVALPLIGWAAARSWIAWTSPGVSRSASV